MPTSSLQKAGAPPSKSSQGMQLGLLQAPGSLLAEEEAEK